MNTQQPQRMQQQDIDTDATEGRQITVVPEDIYLVEFTLFEPGPDFVNQNDPSVMDHTIRLVYTILEGDWQGEQIDELASLPGGGPKAKLRQRAEVLLGRAYTTAERIRLIPLYGRQARAVVKVEPGKRGERNRIESLIALPQARPAVSGQRPASAATRAPAREWPADTEPAPAAARPRPARAVPDRTLSVAEAPPF